MSPEQDIGVWLRRGLWLLTWATAVLYVVVVTISVGGYLTLRGSQQRNTRALCALRADIERRVQISKDFLIAHPHGIPGFPAATIKASLDNQERSIDALSGLNCN